MTEEQPKAPGLFEFLNAVSETKKDLLIDPSHIKAYDPYMINLGLSQHYDTIAIADAMNLSSGIPKRQHFEFLLSVVPSRKRRGVWAKKLTKQKDEITVSRALGCSVKLAREHLKLLTVVQLQALEARVYEGGKG